MVVNLLDVYNVKNIKIVVEDKIYMKISRAW